MKQNETKTIIVSTKDKSDMKNKGCVHCRNTEKIFALSTRLRIC